MPASIKVIKKKQVLMEAGWYRTANGWWHDRMGEINRWNKGLTLTRAYEIEMCYRRNA